MPDPGSPPPFAVPDTLQSLVREIGRHGERDAIVFFDRGSERRWSYRRLAEDAEKLARGLARHGIGAKDALVIRARNRPEWIRGLFRDLAVGGHAGSARHATR